MDRVVNKAKTYKDAEEWDVLQQTEMTHEQRQEIARILKERFWKGDSPDVRKSRAFRKRSRSQDEE